MHKPINIQEFEHLFSEKSLKKSLSLIRKRQFIVSAKDVNTLQQFSFHDKNNTLLLVERLGEKIIFSYCSCRLDKCEHLGVAILYFQNEVLKNLTAKVPLRKREATNDIFKKQCLLLRKKIKNEFNSEFHGNDLKEIIEEFKIETSKNNKLIIVTHLAILNEITGNLKYKRKAADDESISYLIRESKTQLKKCFKGRISDENTEACVNATLNSVNTALRFNSMLFTFLIPYVASFVKSKSIIDNIKNELLKQQLKLQPLGSLDWKLIAQLHLEKAEALLEGKRGKKANSGSAEYFITEAQRAWIRGNKKEAFKVLAIGFEKLRALKPASLLSYIEYAIEKSQEYDNSKEELFYTQQILIFSPFINQNHLKRFKELISPFDKKKYVDEIIMELKKNEPDTFEKVIEILESEERYDELIFEISKHKGKFRLLNDIAIKKLPYFDESLLKIYVKQFQWAINLALETHYQKQIFNDARKFIDALPIETKQYLVSQLLDVTGRHSYIRSCILKLYY